MRPRAEDLWLASLSNAFAVTNQWIGDFAVWPLSGNPRPLARAIVGVSL
jgi:hypothetical protein